MRYRVPSIEDIEFGYRLRDAGARIRFLPDLQGTHLKRWHLLELMRIEIFQRAIPWSRLMLERGGLVDELNAEIVERGRAILVAGSLLVLLLAAFDLIFWWLPGACAGAIVIVNLELFRLFLRTNGLGFALGGITVPPVLLSLCQYRVWVGMGAVIAASGLSARLGNRDRHIRLAVVQLGE